ncbi:hypothetical protein GCM10010187_48710 [Actinomadura coerulea]|nr:hypothetical protein GCM10010187_48710 [Actinomadura coerulea]
MPFRLRRPPRTEQRRRDALQHPGGARLLLPDDRPPYEVGAALLDHRRHAGGQGRTRRHQDERHVAQLGDTDRRPVAGAGRSRPGRMGDVDVVRPERQRREPVAGVSDVEREAGRDDLRRAGGEHVDGLLLRAELVDVHDRLGVRP